MDIFRTRRLLGLGQSGVMFVGVAQAGIGFSESQDASSIVAISGPNVRVAVYDGIAAVVGVASSVEETNDIEAQIAAVEGVVHVIDLVRGSGCLPGACEWMVG